MSARTKGRNTENQFKICIYVFLFKKVLERWGYAAIEQARPTLKMIGNHRFVSTQNDFYGLFDLMAKKKNKTLYVQVKSNISDVYKSVKKIRGFMNNHGTRTDEFLVALKIPRKGFKLYLITKQKYDVGSCDLKGREV